MIKPQVIYDATIGWARIKGFGGFKADSFEDAIKVRDEYVLLKMQIETPTELARRQTKKTKES